MDLKQRKLSKSEWDSIEMPVSDQESDILKLITTGYTDVNIKVNKTNSLFTFLKIEYSQQMEDFLYNRHFATKIKSLLDTHKITYIKFTSDNNKYRGKTDAIQNEEKEKDADQNTIYHVKICAIVKLKSSDQIRIDRLATVNHETSEIYEFILIKHLEQLFQHKTNNNKLWIFSRSN